MRDVGTEGNELLGGGGGKIFDAVGGRDMTGGVGDADGAAKVVAANVVAAKLFGGSKGDGGIEDCARERANPGSMEGKGGGVCSEVIGMNDNDWGKLGNGCDMGDATWDAACETGGQEAAEGRNGGKGRS